MKEARRSKSAYFATRVQVGDLSQPEKEPAGKRMQRPAQAALESAVVLYTGNGRPKPDFAKVGTPPCA